MTKSLLFLILCYAGWILVFHMWQGILSAWPTFSISDDGHDWRNYFADFLPELF